MENPNRIKSNKINTLRRVKIGSYRAFYWHLRPEGLRTLIDCDKELTEDLAKIPENERDLFKTKI